MAYLNALRSVAVAASVAMAVAAQSQTQSLADAQVDSLKASHHLIYMGQESPQLNDSVLSMLSAFYYDQFHHFQDPAAPYFLFLSKDANLAMGVGGCVRMRGYYDWGGAIPSSGFAPALIPMTPDPAQMRKFGTTPSGTSLFFRVIGRNKRYGNYRLYIQADFTGYQGRDFKLKKAYAELNDWTIGYATSTFSDPSALPPVIDAQGSSNKVSLTSVLVRWMHTVKKNWVVALSAETPDRQVDTRAENTKKVDDWLPDFATFVQYQWGPSQHIRLSGLMRTLSYRNMLEEKNHNLLGWGASLSTVFHPWSPVTVYGTLSGGRGLASVGGDMMISSFDLMGDPARPGDLYAPGSYGYTLGLQYNYRPEVFSSACVGVSRYLPRHEVNGDDFKNGIYCTVNTFWNLTARIQVGAELNLGMRKNVDGAHRWARRIGALAQFSF